MNQDILTGLAKLHRQGHEITLAKLKGATTGRHPMPTLIQAIKAYQADPEAVLSQLSQSPDIPAYEEDTRILRLESQILELTDRIAALEAKLG